MVASILLLVISCQAKLKLECLVDYLKFRNASDDALSSVESYSGDPATCADDVRAKVEEIYGVTRSKMDSNIMQKPHADCAMKYIENESYENLLLKAEAIDMKGVGLKFWKISSKNSMVEDYKKKAQEIVDAAFIRCKGQSDYGVFFDAFYEQKRTEAVNDDLDFCIRKHLVDRSVINPTLYNFKLNPKNLEVSRINCEDIMSVSLEQMRASITNAGNSCVINTFVDNGYLDLIMKIQLLSKLNLTQTQKLAEKRSFIDAMINMTHQIRSCPM